MKKYFSYIFFALLTLAVMFPLFRPGFVFFLDMVFTPKINLKEYISDGRIPTHFPLIVLIKLFSYALPMEIVQKIILTLLLFLPMAFMYRLTKKFLPGIWAIVSGIIYIFNPWMYERFLAGHWLVLLGYAFLPLLLHLFLNLLELQDKKGFIKFLVLFSIFPIFSIHIEYISFFLLVFIFLVYSISKKNSLSTPFFKKSVKIAAICIVTTLLINSFWLIGFFKPAAPYTAISEPDFSAFQTVSDPQWGVYFNTLSLYGFWNQDYTLPKETLPFWPAITICLIGLSIVGAYKSFKEKNLLGMSLVLLFLPALILAVGFSSPFSAKLTTFFYNYLPGFKGLRETGKITSLIVLAYSVLVPLGAVWIFENTKAYVAVPEKVFKYTLAAFTILLTLASVYTMFGGFHGQLKPVSYPTSWHEADALTQTNSGKILFLPWWGYLRMPFTGNNLVANPAVRFFKNPVLTGQGFQNSKFSQFSSSETDTLIQNLIEGKNNIDEAIPQLRQMGIEYIILVEEEDTTKYNFLFESQNLKRALVSNDLVLFQLPK
jgi:hypothetical protein